MYEYINTGLFYLKDIRTDIGALTAKFTGEGLLYFLSLSTYDKGLLQTITMSSLAQAVLTDAGLASSQYVIDTALSSISLYGYLDVMTHKECLQAIAIASNAVLYEDRLGRICIKPLSLTPTSKSIATSAIFGEPRIQTNKSLKSVDVCVYTPVISATTAEIAKVTLPLTGTTTVQITYDKPASNVSAVVSSGTISSETYYTNTCTLRIIATGTVTITVSGREVTSTTTSQTYPTGNIDGEVYNTKNPLVTSVARADSIASHVINLKTYLNDIDVPWRGDPSMEVGDVLDYVQHKFGLAEDTIITENVIEYDGTVRADTVLKGVPV